MFFFSGGLPWIYLCLLYYLKYSEKQISCKQLHNLLSRESSLFTHAADCSETFGNAKNPDIWAGGGASDSLQDHSDAFAALPRRLVTHVQLLLLFALERAHLSIRRLLWRVNWIGLMCPTIMPQNQSFSFRLWSGVSPALILREACPAGKTFFDLLHIWGQKEKNMHKLFEWRCIFGGFLPFFNYWKRVRFSLLSSEHFCSRFIS